jgi:hypothetical protein
MISPRTGINLAISCPTAEPSEYPAMKSGLAPFCALSIEIHQNGANKPPGTRPGEMGCNRV